MQNLGLPSNTTREEAREQIQNPQPGSVGYLRAVLTRELRRVAPWQVRFLKPKINIRHLGPNVATVSLVGMWFITAKQYKALDTALQQHKPVQAVLILTLGREV